MSNRDSSSTARTPTSAGKDRDTILKELFKLDYFKGNFDQHQFIETLCGNIAQAKDKEFDPRPLIRNFESATEELLRIKRKLQSKLEDLEDQQLVSNDNGKVKVQEFGESLEVAKKKFETLESRLGAVGNTAIRIGEQLETIDKHRKRAAEAKDIIQYFIEFNDGKTERLDAVRDSGQDGEYRAAIIARRLSTIAKEVDLLGTELGRASIEKFCEALEKSLLSQFDTAYKEEDRLIMAHIAKTLMEFNGGNSCVQSYVAQHAFFINLLKLAQNDEQAETEGDSNDKTHQALPRLYDEIRQTITAEWEVINQVFPNALSVMQNFLQRIFAQSIQNFLEVVLKHAAKLSKEEYLESLAICHSETASLVADLHDFDEYVVAKSFGIPSLTILINRSFEDLFVPYIDSNRYILAEKDWMVSKFGEHLAAFNSFLVQLISFRLLASVQLSGTKRQLQERQPYNKFAWQKAQSPKGQ